jgi:hypothetical protein
MPNLNPRVARVNQQRFSHEVNLQTLKSNLFNCVGVQHRAYINKQNQEKIFVEFQFANGTTSLSIDPTDDVETLLFDFMNNTGEFTPQIPTKIREEVK